LYNLVVTIVLLFCV